MKKYSIVRICGNCNHEMSFEVSKREAAFELFITKELIEKKCKKCSSKDFKNLSFEKPEIDKELILEWIKDDNLYFSRQDEDLILADVDYKVLIEIIDNYHLSKYKHWQLVAALCIFIYDNSIEEDGDLETRNQIIEELKKRKNHLQKVDDWLMDYVKDVVYPLLDFLP